MTDDKPLHYKEFIASGHKDSEWDAYLEDANQKSATKARKTIASKWIEGFELDGNTVANFLRAVGVPFPQGLSMLLQHDDTTVSSTSVTGRGVKKLLAKKLHKAVSLAMGKAIEILAGDLK